MAAGVGSRLYPTTLAVSKHLLPIYDKPMIYYPLSVLMLAGVRDILLICNAHDLCNYQRLLGTGEKYGINLQYAIQPQPRGIAEAFTIGADFIGDDRVWLILGDNLFYGQGFSGILKKVANYSWEGATIFAYPVNNPSEFAVIQLDDQNQPKSLVEKPSHSPSSYAVTGLYFYDNQIVDIARCICPSHRGELEITSINQVYLEKGQLRVEVLGRGLVWLDAGTPERLLEASELVHTLQKRQGFQIACLEEIAYRNGWLTQEDILREFKQTAESSYKKYLFSILGNSYD